MNQNVDVNRNIGREIDIYLEGVEDVEVLASEKYNRQIYLITLSSTSMNCNISDKYISTIQFIESMKDIQDIVDIFLPFIYISGKQIFEGTDITSENVSKVNNYFINCLDVHNRYKCPYDNLRFHYIDMTKFSQLPNKKIQELAIALWKYISNKFPSGNYKDITKDDLSTIIPLYSQLIRQSVGITFDEKQELEINTRDKFKLELDDFLKQTKIDKQLSYIDYPEIVSSIRHYLGLEYIKYKEFILALKSGFPFDIGLFSAPYNISKLMNLIEKYYTSATLSFLSFGYLIGRIFRRFENGPPSRNIVICGGR